MSILLLWVGTFIWKNDRTKKQTYKINYPNKQKPTSINTQTEQQIKQPQTKTTESKCKHYCGYLKNRNKAEEIPEECLTCEKLIQCS